MVLQNKTMSFLINLFSRKKEYSKHIILLSNTSFAKATSGKKVPLIDVRTPNEYAEGHIKNAINVDFFSSKKFTSYFEKLDKTIPLFIYCRSGSRSKSAAHKLAAMGFEKIYDLQGGFSKY